MKKILTATLSLVLSLVLLNSAQAVTWTSSQINESGFGNNANYSSALFKHHGNMYAVVDNDNGIKLWQYDNSTGEWTENTDSTLVQNNEDTQVASIVKVQDKIYVALKNETDGVEVWAKDISNTDAWNQVNENGFGDSNNVTGILYTDGSTVYAAAENSAGNAQIWASSDEGENWSQLGETGLGDNVEKITAASTKNIDGVLNYIIGTNEGKLYSSTDSITWTLINDFSSKITALEKFKGRLIIAVKDEDNGAKLYKSKDLVNFSKIAENGFGNANNTEITMMKKSKNGHRLIVATNNETTGLEIWSTNKLLEDSWVQSFSAGINNANNTKVGDYIWYKGDRYVSTYNAVDGTEIYELDYTR